MIAVLARPGDAGADALLERWAPAGARRLAPADLCTRGWVHRTACRCGTAVVDGEPMPVRALAGVVTRILAVTEDDLGPIVAADRPYVAAEMTAFLLAWLSSLPCPVVNRPSPLGLAGPNLRPEGWLALAARAGIPVRPLRRDRDGYDFADVAAREEVTVVGGRALGEVSQVAREYAVRLAREADATMLVAGFDGAELVDAHPWPDLARADVAGALLELLAER